MKQIEDITGYFGTKYGLLGLTDGHAWTRMVNHITKLVSHNSFHIKNISSKFHQNLMTQIEDLLSNVLLGPDFPNCPTPFRTFRPYFRDTDFPRHAVFCSMIKDNKYFHLQQEKIHINGLDLHQNTKYPLLGRFGPFLSKFGETGLFFEKKGLHHFLR